MVLLNCTNIVIDDFQFPSTHDQPYKYKYFITHWHKNQFKGLNKYWKHGTIYCSQLTKKFLNSKFPELNDIVEFQLNKEYEIYLNYFPEVKIKIRLFDSNHIPGSVMILFEGYCGRILYTGDMKFNIDSMNKIQYLFPHGIIPHQKCSIDIDQILFDSTYCENSIDFLKESEIFKMLCEIIQNYRGGRKVYVVAGHLGPEFILKYLAEKFKTLIVVDYQRFKYIQFIYRSDAKNYFSIDRQKGWIQVVERYQKFEKNINYEKSILITLTDAINTQIHYSSDKKRFIIPYSTHSTLRDLQVFFQITKPYQINPIYKINDEQKLKSLRNFLDSANVSKQYKQLIQDEEKQIQAKEALGISNIFTIYNRKQQVETYKRPINESLQKQIQSMKKQMQINLDRIKKKAQIQGMKNQYKKQKIIQNHNKKIDTKELINIQKNTSEIKAKPQKKVQQKLKTIKFETKQIIQQPKIFDSGIKKQKIIIKKKLEKPPQIEKKPITINIAKQINQKKVQIPSIKFPVRQKLQIPGKLPLQKIKTYDPIIPKKNSLQKNLTNEKNQNDPKLQIYDIRAHHEDDIDDIFLKFT